MYRAATLIALLIPAVASAQDDAAAGLFTEARQLPLVSQGLTVEIEGDEALLHLTQVFANEGVALGQADYQLHLPEGASVEGFGFWNRDRFLTAELQARDEARAHHRAAASEGRATAIMDREGSMHSFSVFPVEGGSLKQVETTLRLPVEVEGGRREVRLPVDRFLGQAGATSTVTVRLSTDRPLAEVGLSQLGGPGGQGANVDAHQISRSEQAALLVATTHHPLVLHWQEEAPPLDLWARTTETPDGTAVAVRVSLNDLSLSDLSLKGRALDEAGLGPAPWQRVVLVVDGSTSMRRRRAAVQDVLARVSAVAHLPVITRSVAEGRAVPGLPESSGHATTWSDLAAALADEDCGATARCLVLTDPQLSGIAKAELSPAELIILADPHEAAHFADALPPKAAVYQPGSEPLARLRSMVDQAVLPVLQIDRLLVGERELSPIGDGPWRVAEGGLLRLHALADDIPTGELTIEGRIDGAPLTRTVAMPDAAAGDTDATARVRRGVYRDLLASWMRGWKDQPDEGLKTRITELSLREGIPTAFTSLQVDDPELSLVAIKPGDPTLRVDGGPGVTDVVAWYPFGDMRRLVREGDTYSDRFLVPRYWQEEAYRVDSFSRSADGHVEQKGTWYVLDEAAPEARIELEGGVLAIHTGDQTPDIGAVEVHAPGKVWRLSLDAGAPAAEAERWTIDSTQLPAAFTVVVRDRAGNVARWPATIDEDGLAVHRGRRDLGPAPELPDETPAIQAGQGPMSVDGTVAVVHLADRSLRFEARGLDLRSLRLTAAEVVGDQLFLGTAGGDLLAVTCDGGECSAQRVETGHPEHPITGLAALSDGTVLVGILGAGLVELDGAAVTTSSLRVGSRFVTALATAPDGDVLIGTAYNGLWRIARGRGPAIRTRFSHEHVAGLSVPGDLLAAMPVLDVEVDSGHGRFLRISRDRFHYESPALNHLDMGADDLVDLLPVGDFTYVAGFDSGLWRIGPEGELLAVGLPLSADEARINALALHEGRLYLATEGGLLSVDPDRPETGVERILDAAAHDLDDSEQGLAVATSDGLYVMRRDLQRVDVEGPLASPTVGNGRFLSVAWHGDDLFAGTLDGLIHLDRGDLGFEPLPVTVADGLEASWVTALHSDGDTLYIGTYADGLWAAFEDGIGRVDALADQWVPPHALSLVGDDLWVGGIGMSAARIDRDGLATAVRLPVRDVNAVVAGPEGGLLVATSDGLVRIEAASVASR